MNKRRFQTLCIVEFDDVGEPLDLFALSFAIERWTEEHSNVKYCQMITGTVKAVSINDKKDEIDLDEEGKRLIQEFSIWRED